MVVLALIEVEVELDELVVNSVVVNVVDKTKVVVVEVKTVVVVEERVVDVEAAAVEVEVVSRVVVDVV